MCRVIQKQISIALKIQIQNSGGFELCKVLSGYLIMALRLIKLIWKNLDLNLFALGLSNLDLVIWWANLSLGFYEIFWNTYTIRNIIGEVLTFKLQTSDIWISYSAESINCLLSRGMVLKANIIYLVLTKEMYTNHFKFYSILNWNKIEGK